MASDPRSLLVRRALWLEYFTVGWNVLEGIVAIAAGAVAGSIALIGFGLDSGIEVTSGAILIWRFRQHGMGDDVETAAERRAVYVVGVTFLLLALYVSVEALRKLWLQERPEESVLGIIVTLLSLALMPSLALLKRRIAGQLGSRALLADAKETLACSYLSFTVLLGLGANALFGLWWADPLAALAIVYWLVREGREALEEARGEDEDD
ncbi:MAG: cation transporter [Chloroflexi bacterium]|nr:cation transporter [Chloroflexota bacterium]